MSISPINFRQNTQMNGLGMSGYGGCQRIYRPCHSQEYGLGGGRFPGAQYGPQNTLETVVNGFTQAIESIGQMLGNLVGSIVNMLGGNGQTASSGGTTAPTAATDAKAGNGLSDIFGIITGFLGSPLQFLGGSSIGKGIMDFARPILGKAFSGIF